MKALFATPIALAPGRSQPVRGELTLRRSHSRYPANARSEARREKRVIGMARFSIRGGIF